MVLVSLLMAALVLMVGCAPRATSGQIAASADESQIAVDLPALVLDVQPNGNINVGGQPLAEVGGGVAAGLAASLVIPPDMVSSITAFNIQHIQIDNTAEGLLILVNGQPVPSIAWDGEKLVATADVLETFGAGQFALLDRVLPLLTNLGIGVIFRFPVAEGQDALPMVAAESEAATRALAAQQEFLAAVGAPPVVHFTIAYAADGSWTIADLDQASLAQMGIPTNMLNLGPATIQSVSSAGISEIGIATNSDGIFISINGQTLPYLTWADGRVNHLLSLAEESGLLAMAMGDSPDTAAILDTIESLLPAVQASDVSLTITFP